MNWPISRHPLPRLAQERVPTHGSPEHGNCAQLDALTKAPRDRVFSETASSVKAQRPQREECLRILRTSDTLIAQRLDRLERNVAELVEIVNDLAKRDIGFESLTKRIDTSSASGQLAFHVFAALAQFERNIIRERTLAGLAAARARGRYGGPPEKTTDREKDQMITLYNSKTMPVQEICDRYGISRATFYRYKDERLKEESTSQSTINQEK